MTGKESSQDLEGNQDLVRCSFQQTNAKAVAGMYGTKTEEWVGKKITLYPTQTAFGNDTVDCIRVRPTIPKEGT